MRPLDTGRINEYAPYKVELVNGQYIFETDYGIQYGVSQLLSAIHVVSG